MEKMERINASDAATVELLGEMYRNVTTGSENLAAAVPRIRDGELMAAVTAQLERYAEYTDRVARLMKRRSRKPKELSAVRKAVSRGAVLVNALTDPAAGSVARMISRETKEGMVRLEDRLSELEARGCSRDAADLCRDILAFEEEAARTAPGAK